MPQISINALLKWNDDQSRIERVLWIDPLSQNVWCIDLKNSSSSWPISYQRHILETFIQNGDVAIAPDADPFIELKSCDITRFSLDAQAQMEKFWPVFSRYIGDKRLFNDQTRIVIQREISEELGIRLKLVRKYLRRFMASGFSRRGLAQYTHNRGGRGQKRIMTKDGKRLGNRRKGDTSDVKSGIPITLDIEEKFETSLNMFKRYTSKTKHKNGIAEVRPTKIDEYNYMLSLHFSEYLEQRVQFDSPSKKLQPINYDNIPTERQYYNWRRKYLQNKSHQKVIDQNRFGSRHVGSNMSSHFGSINDIALMVGMYDVIDATPFDIYLRSSPNRNLIIGRPTLYVVMDAFSGYIKNVYLTLEGESYATISMVLADTYISKIQKCALHGIEIQEEDWPTFIGRFLLTDHGVGYVCKESNNITDLSISPATTPAFRPDNKGIIESNLKTFKTELAQKLPGAILHDNPADTKYKDELRKSRYNLDEVMGLLIQFVLYYNQNHPRVDFPISSEMFADDTQPYPADLIKWSIRKNGALRTETPETVFGALLPKYEALITSQGIIYEVDGATLRYEPDDAGLHSLFYVQKKSWIVKIARHPWVVNTIFICADPSRGLNQTISCHLIDSADMDLYRNLSFPEIGTISEKLAQNRKEQMAREHSRRLNNLTRITKKNIEVENAYQAVRHLSDPSTETNITENRNAEIARRRQTSLPLSMPSHSVDTEVPAPKARGIINPELQAKNARQIRELWNKKGDEK